MNTYAWRTASAVELLGREPYWALISQAERDKAVADGNAMQDGSYPIRNCAERDKAIGAVGRGGADHDAIRRHIIRQTKKHNCSDYPDNWNSDGSLKESSNSAGEPVRLTGMKTRSELIAAWSYGGQASLAAPPPPPPPPPAKGDAPPPPPAAAKPADPDKPSPEAADAAVATAIGALKSASDAAAAAQAKDPDTSDPTDQQVAGLLKQIGDLVAQVEKAQSADTDSTAKPAEPEAVPPPGPDKPASPPAPVANAADFALPPPLPGDTPAVDTPPPDGDQGDIDDTIKCANPDCGHFASAHEDTDDGENQGHCQMVACDCPAMETDNKGSAGPGDDDGSDDADSPVGAPEGDPANTIGTSSARRGALAAPELPVPGSAPVPPTSDTPAPNAPPPVAGSEAMGPAFTIPVAVIEGQPVGDGDNRVIALEALSWRVPPLPLMGLKTAPHDPSGLSPNDPAVICGRIDELTRTGGEEGTQVITAKGFYLPNDDGEYFAQLNEAMGRMGISADIAVESQAVTGELDPETGWPIEESYTLTKGTIMGLTVCSHPAFEGAYIVLGDGADGGPAAVAIPATTEAKAPSENPPPMAATARLTTYEDCGCDPSIEVLVASAAPSRPPLSWFSNPNFTADDGRLVEILEKRGSRALGGKWACPISVTEEGRVFGHLAPWGVCHTAERGACVVAPRSRENYAHFKTGHVVTAEGESVRTGVLTVGTGHASQRQGTSVRSVMEHYDNTGTAVADVNIGEDDYGIWVAGAIRPSASDDQVRALRGASLSGDWRGVGGGLELFAALCVNTPGFPLAVVAAGQLESLTASGSAVIYRLNHPPEPAPSDPGDVVLRAALQPLLVDAKGRARERLAKLGA